MTRDFDFTTMFLAVRQIRQVLTTDTCAVCLLHESHYEYLVVDPVLAVEELTRNCRLVVPDDKETAGNWIRVSDLPESEVYAMMYIDNFLFVRPALDDEC